MWSDKVLKLYIIYFIYIYQYYRRFSAGRKLIIKAAIRAEIEVRIRKNLARCWMHGVGR